MAFNINSIQKLHNQEDYLFHHKHRIIGNANASVWCIDYQVEYNLADTSITNNYLETRNTLTAFNVLKVQNTLQIIGHNARNNPCYIAKFVKSNPNQWHGYPGDYIANNQDKPSQVTLTKFLQANIISKKEMRHISRGQKL